MAVGKKTGGRQKGTPNAVTVARAAAAAAEGGAGGAPPGGAIVTGRARAREADPRIRMVVTTKLVPDPKNSRTHTAEQITKIVASIREFGFTNPILTDGKRGILAGEGRWRAALQIGIERVPTLPLAHLTAKQRRAYVLADNRLALDAGWDEDMLTAELGELRDDHFDLALTGFDDAELAALLDDDDETETPEPRQPVRTTVKATCPKCGHTFKV